MSYHTAASVESEHGGVICRGAGDYMNIIAIKSISGECVRRNKCGGWTKWRRET